MNARQVTAVVRGWERYLGSLHQHSTLSMAFDAGWDCGKEFAAPTKRAVTPCGRTVDVVDGRSEEQFGSRTCREDSASAAAWEAAEFDDQECAFAAGWSAAEDFIRITRKKKGKMAG